MSNDNAAVEDLLKEVLVELRALRKLKEEPVKIDAVDALKQLSRGAANQHWIHLFEWNERWTANLAEKNRRAAKTTYDFIDEKMPNAAFARSQMQYIESLKDEIVGLDGEILDLGVYKGGSTRTLARIFQDHTIHGFDSFEGLPEDWTHVLKGTFGELDGNLPDMPDNVKLYKGWFSDTLPPWAAAREGACIALLRVDCDIYSSTVDIFESVGHMLVDQTIVVFDEYLGYRGWEQHEHKAFMEFIDRSGFSYEYLAHGLSHCIVRLSK